MQTASNGFVIVSSDYYAFSNLSKRYMELWEKQITRISRILV